MRAYWEVLVGERRSPRTLALTLLAGCAVLALIALRACDNPDPFDSIAPGAERDPVTTRTRRHGPRRPTTVEPEPVAPEPAPDIGGVEPRADVAPEVEELPRSRLTVRDLLTEEPVAGVTLLLQRTGDEFTSSADGVIDVHTNERFRLQVTDAQFAPADPEREFTPGHTADLFIARSARLTGVVRLADGAPLRDHWTTLRCVPARLNDQGRVAHGGPSALHSGRARAGRHEGVVLSGAGRFDLAVPRMESVALLADAEGYRLETVLVDTTSGTAEVEIVLQPARRVTVQIEGPDGEPAQFVEGRGWQLGEQTVHLYASVTDSGEHAKRVVERHLLRLHALDAGGTLNASAGRYETTAVWTVSSRQVEVELQGALSIRVHCRGMRPVVVPEAHEGDPVVVRLERIPE